MLLDIFKAKPEQIENDIYLVKVNIGGGSGIYYHEKYKYYTSLIYT